MFDDEMTSEKPCDICNLCDPGAGLVRLPVAG
ncbi:hypothetical protein F383_34462 [Gossypium arboreum]|uniref:Uncharacterized protein n=1 Tax=Gossypium arboreum TaxID=29729 RepID=A0A0B0N4C5_GOSAR|nr:hypothetical protein F383_34462 [Gossypium arboreum]